MSLEKNGFFTIGKSTSTNQGSSHLLGLQIQEKDERCQERVIYEKERSEARQKARPHRENLEWDPKRQITG